MLSALLAFADTTQRLGYIISMYANQQILSRSGPTLLEITTRTTVTTLIDIDTQILAEQLTLQEQMAFCACKPREFLSQNWNSPLRSHKSPNIIRLLKESSNVSLWVTDTIDERVEIFCKFVRLAQALYEMSNYSTLFHVMTALKREMHSTWKLDDDTMNQYKILEKLVDPYDNFKMLRDSIHSAERPCIPHLSLYLDDLQCIEETKEQSQVHTNTMNYYKCVLVHEVIQEITSFQETKYQYVRDVNIDYELKSKIQAARNRSDKHINYCVE